MRKADLLKPETLTAKYVDVVVHLAALIRFHDTWERLYAHNGLPTQLNAKDALHHNIQHFIYGSSTETIGLVTTIPGDEASLY
ncbi:hypothetical protein AYK25_09285 [Thermoplasmatales archaeon SM1-50]|nr:MAG: hypothetical protein AYK25_09285 [Thermoplasmatales archaeon SM1-50]